MNRSLPIFIADSCIGGLSVIKSLWAADHASDVIFLADYAINPLGVKPAADIADVAERWLQMAEERSDTLVMACNTLSVRHRCLPVTRAATSSPKNVVSMVDCFAALVKAEQERLTGRKVLIIGTRYTAGQKLYPDMLRAAVPNVLIRTAAATELERAVARFESWNDEDESVLNHDLRRSLRETDFAVLACTCFPLVMNQLESLFPEVIFLDPSAYCTGLLRDHAATQNKRLRIKTTGDVVSAAQAVDFAESLLGTGDIECFT